MRKEQIYALHGFLGNVSDWDCFCNLTLKPLDLFRFSKEMSSLKEFGRALNASLQDPEQILMGYSMGARLGLQALIDAPQKWKAAILVSANPGLVAKERNKRLEHDAQWLQRFLDNFNKAFQEWNTNSIFQGDHFKRDKPDDRVLEQCLKGWSLGMQEDLREAISKLPMPILWIVGEKDKKFCDLAQGLKFLHPKSRIWIAQNAAHRIPWDLKEIFEKEVKTFIEGLVYDNTVCPMANH